MATQIYRQIIWPLIAFLCILHMALSISSQFALQQFDFDSLTVVHNNSRMKQLVTLWRLCGSSHLIPFWWNKHLFWLRVWGLKCRCFSRGQIGMFNMTPKVTWTRIHTLISGIDWWDSDDSTLLYSLQQFGVAPDVGFLKTVASEGHANESSKNSEFNTLKVVLS